MTAFRREAAASLIGPEDRVLNLVRLGAEPGGLAACLAGEAPFPFTPSIAEVYGLHAAGGGGRG